MMKKKFTLTGLALLGTMLVGSLFAQGLHPQPTNQEEAQKVAELRRGFFLVAQWHIDPFFWMATMRNNFPFDRDFAGTLAHRVELTAELIPSLFELDTRQFDIETHAQASLWNNLPNVQRMAADLATNARQFATAIENAPEPPPTGLGLPAPVFAAYQSMNSAACGDCHNSYRQTLPSVTQNASSWSFTSDGLRPHPNNALWGQRIADTQNGLFLVLEWLQQPVDRMVSGEVSFDAEAAAQQAAYIEQYALMIPELLSQDPNFCAACDDIAVTPLVASWADVDFDEVAAEISAKAQELAERFAAVDGDEVPEDLAGAWGELTELLNPGA